MTQIVIIMVCSISMGGCFDAKATQPSDLKQASKYSVTATINPTAVDVGVPATFQIAFVLQKGYELKSETPFKAKLSSTGHINIEQVSFTNGDFDNPKAANKSISTTVVGTQPANTSIVADLTFFICDETLCERYKEHIETQWVVTKQVR